MKIVNNEKIITNNQIMKILKITNKLSNSLKIVVLEHRTDMFKLSSELNIFDWISFFGLFNGECVGIYNEFYCENYIMVKLYHLGIKKEDKKLYGIGSILFGIEQCNNDNLEENYINDKVKEFLNINSKAIKDILNLKYEWEIEEF